MKAFRVSLPWCRAVVWGVVMPLGAQEPGSSQAGGAEAMMERALNDTQLKAAGRRSQGAEEAPADVTVLSGQELRALGYRTVGAALAGVLGFRANGDPAYENMGVRGLYLLGDQNTRVLVLLDGHALNSAAEVGSSKVGEDFGIPVTRIDRIEIIRGPASSLYGNNAFLGVVNIVTLEAVEEGSGKGFLGVTGGSGGLSEVWGSTRVQLGGVRLSLNAGSFQRQGTAQAYPQLSPTSLAAGLDREDRDHAYFVAQGTDWSFSAYWMNRLQRLAVAPFQSQVGSEGNLYRNRLAFGELRLEPKWGEIQGLARITWDWNLFSDQYDYDGVRDPSLVGRSTDRDLNRSFGGELQARGPLGEAWHLIGGLEQTWQTFSFTLGGPGTSNPREIRYRVRKLYGEAEWAPTGAFSLTVGLQHSALLLDAARALLNPSRTFVLGTYGRWSPRAALVWRPTETDTLKGLYSEGIRNPTLFERFSEDDGLAFVDNPGLRLESMQSGGLLWLRDWGHGWTSQVGAHALRWSEAIQSVALNDTQQQFQNAPDDLRGRFLEAQIRWRKGAWDLLASGALNHWRSGGEDVDNAANSQVSLRAIRHEGSWSEAVEWRGVGSRVLSGQGRIPFEGTLRASFRWESGPASIQLTGEDLLDRRPSQWVASDYDPVRRIQEDGRRLRLDLGWRF